MLLEDTEITNAGYGSNLTLEGKVECDATIVDHEGRSGAAGAVSSKSLLHIQTPNGVASSHSCHPAIDVKNPISLARVILNTTSNPLSLHRVPPNFLVGSGATDFAYENRLPVLPHDALIAEGAKQRWQRWTYELRNADMILRKKAGAQKNQSSINNRFLRHPVQFHPAQLLAAAAPYGLPRAPKSPTDSHTVTQNAAGNQINLAEYPAGPVQSHSHPESAQAQSSGFQDDGHMDMASSAMEMGPMPDPSASDPRSWRAPSGRRDTDNVSDTVGAIAVDSYGNIAAGSSSGGIGMKHPGRVGPAALVGVGTAVIPADPSDPEKAQVATVTSGTGEHIATTMAAHTCALRIYYSQRKCADGLFEEVAEEDAMRGMITTDFLGNISRLFDTDAL